jgi:hypothetical protein
MKTKSLLLGMSLVLIAAWLPQIAHGYAVYPVPGEIRTTADFYEPLAQFGYWIDLPGYGWCWYPASVEQGWRPYSYGHWVWCDEGWYWDSDEPWAWATYHYGRWAWDSFYGWVWVPDVEWGPAWVSWREGSGYVGWAPLPPLYDYAPRTEVVVIAPQHFVFVECRHFCRPIQPSVLVANQTVINQTINITKFGRGRQVVYNHGPSLTTIERNNPGQVVKVKVERQMPAETQQARRQPQQLNITRPTEPMGIRGSRHIANATSEFRMTSPPAGHYSRPVNMDKSEKSERKQKPAPMPPVKVIAKSNPEPAVFPAATSKGSENNQGRKLGHYRPNDNTGTTTFQGR